MCQRISTAPCLLLGDTKQDGASPTVDGDVDGVAALLRRRLAPVHGAVRELGRLQEDACRDMSAPDAAGLHSASRRGEPPHLPPAAVSTAAQVKRAVDEDLRRVRGQSERRRLGTT